MMTTSEKNKERKKINNKLATLSSRGISLGDFLPLASALHPDLADALSGIWCGWEGEVRLELPSYWKAFLIVGWYNKRVEYSYIS